MRYLIENKCSIPKARSDACHVCAVGHLRREKARGRIHRTKISAVYRVVFPYLPFYLVLLQKRQERVIHGAFGKFKPAALGKFLNKVHNIAVAALRQKFSKRAVDIWRTLKRRIFSKPQKQPPITLVYYRVQNCARLVRRLVNMDEVRPAHIRNYCKRLWYSIAATSLRSYSRADAVQEKSFPMARFISP